MFFKIHKYTYVCYSQKSADLYTWCNGYVCEHLGCVDQCYNYVKCCNTYRGTDMDCVDDCYSILKHLYSYISHNCHNVKELASLCF